MTRATAVALAAALLATGCASVSPEARMADVQTLTRGKTGGVTDPLLTREPDARTDALLDTLLARPLTDEAAVRIALANSPSLHGALAALDQADADRAQASRIANPVFEFERLRQGQQVEIGRLLSIDLLGLLTLPWRMEQQQRQLESATLTAAQQVARTAADARRAWVQAVAAEQMAKHLQDAKEAAEAGDELARRMVRVGNWSKLRQAREQAMLSEAAVKLANGHRQAVAARERLIRALGLWGDRTGFTLPDRLPDLPATAPDGGTVEATALAQRLDVRQSVADSRALAQSLGFEKARGVIDVFEVGARRNTVFNDEATGHRETARGAELKLELPLFDWGSTNGARADARYRASLAAVRETAVRARSEAREAWLGWRSAWDLARHYRDEVVPLRRFINQETLLRYNGSLASTWDVLAEVRAQSGAVVLAIESQRDFWLADTDLQLALTATSPGASRALPGAATSATELSKGH